MKFTTLTNLALLPLLATAKPLSPTKTTDVAIIISGHPYPPNASAPPNVSGIPYPPSVSHFPPSVSGRPYPPSVSGGPVVVTEGRHWWWPFKPKPTKVPDWRSAEGSCIRFDADGEIEIAEDC